MPHESAAAGIDVLRKTVAARNHHPHVLTAIAREIDGMSVGALEAFAAGGSLAIDKLNALAKILYPHAELTDDGMLRPVNRAVTPLCTARPLVFKPSEHNIGRGSYADWASRPVDKTPKPSEPPKRAGWLGGFLGR